jgi:hypothetical protein
MFIWLLQVIGTVLGNTGGNGDNINDFVLEYNELNSEGLTSEGFSEKVKTSENKKTNHAHPFHVISPANVLMMTATRMPREDLIEARNKRTTGLIETR